MANSHLLTVFIGLTTLSVLIQTGIVTGLLFAMLKMNQKADRAFAEIRRLVGPLHRALDSMETASTRVSEFSASSHGTFRQLQSRFDRVLEQFRRRIA
jgi:hypothetical protein